MKAYKYCSKYDCVIKPLSISRIFTPIKQKLNDPFEGIVTKKIFDDYEQIRHLLSPSSYEYKINLHKKLLVQIGYLGIYSLSKTWNNELLWVHYAKAHEEFCIEYELDELILDKAKTIIFPKIIEIIYCKKPPIYSLEDAGNVTEEQLLFLLLEKLIGTKSRLWKYEKEIRVLFKENGEQKINSNAIKSIIFGAFASDEDINNTISIMSNKIKYYKIEISKNKYKLLKKRL